MKNFNFDKKNHVYTLDGRRLYGVTNVLSVIAKPALIQWAADEACLAVKKYFENEKWISYSYKFEKFLFEDARLAHRRKKETAGDKGHDIHAMIEDWIKVAIDSNDGCFVGEMPKIGNSQADQLANFWNWATKNNIKFLASEAQLYSETMWIAGTCDVVFEKDGKKYVGDIKTSGRAYPEHFYQMAAYRMMLEEMGEKDFEGSAVIRLGKDGKFDESVDVQWRFDYETDKNAFLGALAIFKANETYERKITKNLPKRQGKRRQAVSHL